MNALECESSDEDENWNSEQKIKVLERIFKCYGDTLNSDSRNDGVAAKYMQDHVHQHSLTCLICISTVKREHKIWTCCNCYDTFHLSCIQQWVREGIYQKGVLSDELFPNREIPWNCPKCRFSYERKNVPFKYMCFCGQQENPAFDPWLTAHSCGQKCERKLRPECGHHCMLLCHPGPCPPCPKMVMTTCFCGKTKNVAKRCGSMMFSCGKQCGKLLLCNKHSCKDVCHEGPCPPCCESFSMPCICGRHTELKSCGTVKWHCDEECGNSLPCSVHKCAKKCHRDECGVCPKSGSRSCPCGKSQLLKLPCSEDVPTCEDTCGKKLGCNNGHACSRRCHYGNCGECAIIVEKKCRCGKKAKKLRCSMPFTCHVKCQKFRDCGIHQCKKMCCDGNCPSCDRVCGKSLQCKRHKCQLMCHQGRCFPCTLQSTLTCKCGSTTLSVMCGQEKTSKPPRCNRLCTTPSSCHHPKRQPHNCHYGPCPACTQICNRTLNCQHKCKDKCHDEVSVESKVKAAGPWELASKPSMRIMQLPCPPCKHGITVKCYGLHETSTVPCSEAKSYCCGRPCGQLLNCGIHTCEMQCHIVNSAEHPDQNVTPCLECEKPCSKPRPDGCPHDCALACHPGSCKRCKRILRILCHCGMTNLKFLCCDFTSADKASKVGLMSCGNECQKVLPCGHPCGKPCHSGQCSESCQQKVVLRCPCKRRKKESTCPQARDGFKVSCDDICEEKILQKEAEKREKLQNKMKEEDEADKELLRFERSLGKLSKSRRKRVTKEETVDPEGWLATLKQMGRRYLLLTCLVVISIAFFCHILLVQA